jgi:signal transduction histidine kinase
LSREGTNIRSREDESLGEYQVDAQREGPISEARLRLRSAFLALFGRRRPRIAIALVFFAAVLVTRYIDTDPGDAVLALNTFPIAIVAFDLGWEQGVVAAGAAFAAVMIWAGARPSDLTPFGYVAGGATYFGTAALLGTFADRLRAARLAQSHLAERAAILEEERGEEARRAVALERSRLARELHDVVSHSLSVITLQAAGARRWLGGDPARATQGLSAIEGAGREALVELRRLLEVLHPEDSMQEELEILPNLENLPELAERMNRAGVHVELQIEGKTRRLPAGVDISAYRIVQEALTNVIKHAGECRVEVRIRHEFDAIELEVRDDGGSATKKSRGAGSGLIGMKERAVLLGGELEAGPRPGGGYRVHAQLPLEQ